MKTDVIDKINYIESKYPVGSITYHGIRIWPFLRKAMFNEYYYEKKTSPTVSRKNIVGNVIKYIKLLRMTSLRLFFIKNATLLFTTDYAGTIRIVNNTQVDRFTAPIIFHEKKYIPIVDKNYKAEISAYSKYIPVNFFNIFINIFFKKKIDKNQFENRETLAEIIADLQISYDIDANVIKIYSCIAFFKKLFVFLKPSKLFIVCYYDIKKMAASYVAKEFGIPVIELQHGMISNSHWAYTGLVNIRDNPYPNYLFCFGSSFKKHVSPCIYKPKNIFVTGNYYFDILKREKEKNRKIFQNKYSKYNTKVIITIAAQNDSELDNGMLEFIGSISNISPDIFFIFVPRVPSKKIKASLNTNIIIETELNIYQCMQNSHITSTVYSTCTIESLVFGTPVILFNINNMAKLIYSGILSETNSVFYANTPEEYCSYITQALSISRIKTASYGESFFTSNSIEKTKQALDLINKTEYSAKK
jgi:hypothetical protein